MNKTITPSKVNQKVKDTWVRFDQGDAPVKGEYGYSLSVGCQHDDDDEWDNYFVNDPKLFDLFEVGVPVVVEYERKGKYNIIGGVGGSVSEEGAGSASGAPVAESSGSRQRSIELQVLVKAYADMYAASSTFPTTGELAANVTSAHKAIFASAADKVKMMAEALDATEEPAP